MRSIYAFLYLISENMLILQKSAKTFKKHLTKEERESNVEYKKKEETKKKEELKNSLLIKV